MLAGVARLLRRRRTLTLRRFYDEASGEIASREEGDEQLPRSVRDPAVTAGER